jgi:hypothetical protein
MKAAVKEPGLWRPVRRSEGSRSGAYPVRHRCPPLSSSSSSTRGERNRIIRTYGGPKEKGRRFGSHSPSAFMHRFRCRDGLRRCRGRGYERKCMRFRRGGRGWRGRALTSGRRSLVARRTRPVRPKLEVVSRPFDQLLRDIHRSPPTQLAMFCLCYEDSPSDWLPKCAIDPRYPRRRRSG